MASPGTSCLDESPSKNLEGYLKAELELGLTLADIAVHQDLPSDEHFGRRKRKAETAASTIHRWKHLLRNNEAKTEILTRCSELEQLISAL